MYTIIAIDGMKREIKEAIKFDFSSFAHLVCKGDLMIDGNFYVTELIDEIACNDPRVQALGAAQKAEDAQRDLLARDEGLLYFQNMEVIALEAAEAYANDNGDLHLMTFNGKVIFCETALLS